MKQLKLKFAEPDDYPHIVEWITANPKNHFDKGILKYPTLQTLCSYSDDGPEAYIPVHRVLALESTALRPGISEGDSAQALRDFTKAAELIASSHGIKEIWFAATDERLEAMASHHGYDVMGEGEGDDFKPWKVMRMKLR